MKDVFLKKTTGSLLAGCLAAAMLACFLACGSSSANVRFVHGSPGTGNIDILVDGRVVAANVAYATAASYLRVTAGTRTIKVRLAGQSADLVNTSIAFSTDSFSTVVIENPPATILAAVYNDDHSSPSSGQAKLRIVHASPTLGAVDLYAVAPGTPIAGSKPQVSDITFPNQTGFTSLAAGNYELFLTLTSTQQVAINSGAQNPVSLPAGQVSTAILLDAPAGGAPWSAVLLTDVP